MLGVKSSASLRALRLCLLGVATVSAAVAFTADTADARRHSRHRHHHSSRASHATAVSYSPAFASIIVDANSGNVLQASNPDGLRHPASLTKIMTLYLLFEQLENGKIKLDTQMNVSAHAASQAPTKLGLRPGQTVRVEDAIKGLVTRSANDAAVVIAEALGGDEDEFAKTMTRKARALGMGKTVYRNASGLPDDEQVTTARDQATLGRAIQERFPKYYRYFATEEFSFRGHVIRGHNHLLGKVEGVDGIKTGYTRASGFNLVTSIRRGNRHLVGVVLGGRSSGARDAAMRSLLAEHIEEGATRHTVAAVTERNSGSDAEVASADEDGGEDVTARTESRAEPKAEPRTPPAIVQSQGAIKVAAAPSEPAPAQTGATAATSQQDKPAPAPLTSGVVAQQSIATIPGSAEPMTPVRVKTVQVRMGQIKVASAGPAPVATSAIPSPRKAEPAEAKPVAVASAEPETASGGARAEPWPTTYNQTQGEFPAPLPAQPNTSNGIGQGIIGVPPAPAAASSEPGRGAPPTTLNAQAQALQAATAPQIQAPAPQPVRQAALTPVPQPQQTIQQNGAIKPAARSGWIIQVGALESESEARHRLEAARGSASKLLGDADPFTETVSKGNRTFYRARFAGLSQDSAEAACRALKRSDISCIAIRN